MSDCRSSISTPTRPAISSAGSATMSDTVNATLSTDLLQICTSLLTVAGSFVMLLMLSPTLAVVFFVTVPLSVVLTRLQMRRIHPLFRLRSKELGALNGLCRGAHRPPAGHPHLRGGGRGPAPIRGA